MTLISTVLITSTLLSNALPRSAAQPSASASPTSVPQMSIGTVSDSDGNTPRFRTSITGSRCSVDMPNSPFATFFTKLKNCESNIDSSFRVLRMRGLS